MTVLIEDRRVFVLKGVVCGLKTVGKHQHKMVEEYLQEVLETKRISKLMLQKATTYLDEKTREKIVES
ncbi:DNA alkylation repair protein [Candidatus Bathyarchaeota archaeon]|nr:DNA alkylation repair protein [Candidatus Bathyarchaeota archaeon]